MSSQPRTDHLVAVDTTASLASTAPGTAQPPVAVHTFPMAAVCLDSADGLYITWDRSELFANVRSKMGLLQREGGGGEEWEGCCCRFVTVRGKKASLFVLFIGHLCNRKVSLPGNSLSFYFIYLFLSRPL